jgi:hypothetical protein
MSEKAKIGRAKRTLEAAGWTVMPPYHSGRRVTLRDQCEFPDMAGSPGDCCINTNTRLRRTKHGTLWLCRDHFNEPASKLFDERAADA